MFSLCIVIETIFVNWNYIAIELWINNFVSISYMLFCLSSATYKWLSVIFTYTITLIFMYLNEYMLDLYSIIFKCNRKLLTNRMFPFSLYVKKILNTLRIFTKQQFIELLFMLTKYWNQFYFFGFFRHFVMDFLIHRPH